LLPIVCLLAIVELGQIISVPTVLLLMLLVLVLVLQHLLARVTLLCVVPTIHRALKVQIFLIIHRCCCCC
jgi:hypothetical protein